MKLSKVQMMLKRLAFARETVIAPVVGYLGIDTGNDVNTIAMLTATGLFESAFATTFQDDGGPALGWFQMEPATHDDLIVNELRGRARLDGKIRSLLPKLECRPSALLAVNQHYAAAMCRVKYLHAIAPIPEWNDSVAIAGYWKAHYNTASGAGDETAAAQLWADVLKSIESGELEGL